MSQHYPRIRVRMKDGFLIMREGLSFTFYMRCPYHEVAPAVLRSLDAYRSAVGPDVLGWYMDQEGFFQEMDSTTWEQFRSDLLAGNQLIAHVTDTARDEQGYQFHYYGKVFDEGSLARDPNAVSVASFWLPTEYLEEHGPARVRELALALADPLPFCSGQGGLSFNGEHELSEVKQAVRELCFRYPGMDIPSPSRVAWHINTKVRGASWLTFLGRPVLDELGGVEGLRSRLHLPETTVQALDAERAVVTLGHWPEAGDTKQGNTLPAYSELAKVLEPWLYQEPYPLHYEFTPEDMFGWERRFLD